MFRARGIAILRQALLVMGLMLFTAAAHAQTFYSSTTFAGWTTDNEVWNVGIPTAGPSVLYAASTGLHGNSPAQTSGRFCSPELSLPALSGSARIILNFSQWYQFANAPTESGGSTYGQVEISIDGSNGPWTPISRTIGRPDLSSGSSNSDWSMSGIDVSSYQGQHVWIAFDYHGGANECPGWFLTYVSLSTLNEGVAVTNFENFTPTQTSGWYSDSGIWQFGSPTGGPAKANGGSKCAATNLAGVSPGSNDSRLISPAINAGNSMILTYYQWYQFANDSSSLLGSTVGTVEVSTTGTGADANWKTVRTIGRPDLSAGSVSSGWTSSGVDLSDYAGKTIWIAFHYHGGADTSPGWFIDDVSYKYIPDMVFDRYYGLEPYSYYWAWWSWEVWYGYSDAGIWQFGKPSQAPNPNSDDAVSLLTNLSGEAPAYSDSREISQPFNLPTVADGERLLLGFNHWFDFPDSSEVGGATYGDVEISKWDSANSVWGEWVQASDNFGPGTSQWSTCKLDLTAYQGTRLRAAWHYHGGAQPAAGWHVDDIAIWLPSHMTDFYLLDAYNGRIIFDRSAGSASVSLKSSDPSILTVPAEGVSDPFFNFQTFPIKTGTVTATKIVTITATQGTKQLSFQYAVGPPPVAGIKLTKSSVAAGASAMGEVWFRHSYPIAEQITLSSSDTSVVKVPATVTIPANTSYAYFPVNAQFVGADSSADVTATLGSSVGMSVPVTALTLVGLNTTPLSTAAGVAVKGNVWFGHSLSTNATINLSSSNNAVVIVPDSVSAVAGSVGTSFPATVMVPGADCPVTITASISTAAGTNSVQYVLNVAALPIAGLKMFAPSSVVAGTSVIGEVWYSRKLSTTGLVSLNSSNPSAASVPSTLSIAAGTTYNTFKVSTGQVGNTTNVAISATVDSTTMQTTVTVKPLPLAGIKTFGNIIKGGKQVIGEVWLGRSATIDTTVTVSSSSTNASVPSTVLVKAGTSYVTFPVVTKAISGYEIVKLTAYTGNKGDTPFVTCNLVITP